MILTINMTFRALKLSNLENVRALKASNLATGTIWKDDKKQIITTYFCSLRLSLSNVSNQRDLIYLPSFCKHCGWLTFIYINHWKLVWIYNKLWLGNIIKNWPKTWSSFRSKKAQKYQKNLNISRYHLLLRGVRI